MEEDTYIMSNLNPSIRTPEIEEEDAVRADSLATPDKSNSAAPGKPVKVRKFTEQSIHFSAKEDSAYKEIQFALKRNDSKYLNVWKAVYLSFAFFIMFAAFFSTINITTQVMRDSGFGSFGYYLLAIIYLCVALCSFIGPAILKRIGTKKCLILGSLGHFTFILSTILPAWRNEYRQNGIDY